MTQKRCPACGGNQKPRRITLGDLSYLCVDWFHATETPAGEKP